MRQKRNRLKTYYHRTAIPKKDGEGSSYVEYGEAVNFDAEMWPAGGKLQAEQYGIRLPNIRNLRVSGRYAEKTDDSGKLFYQIENGPEFTVNDGICLCVPPDSEPDYKIIAIYPYRFLTLEVEKI